LVLASIARRNDDHLEKMIAQEISDREISTTRTP